MNTINMKKSYFLLLLVILCHQSTTAQSWVRVNQIGYLEDDLKIAVWVSKNDEKITKFQVIEKSSGKTVYSGNDITFTGKQPAFVSSARLNFSRFKTPGTYVLQVGDAVSVPFRIGNEVYAGAADIPLKYMRQQRCGYNPFLKDSCHTWDGISVGDPEGKRDGL